MTTQEEVLRLLLAAVLGLGIGLEREERYRTAGMRTHTLVCMAAALLMLVSSYGFTTVVNATHTIVLNPSRIAAQVVSGVGFLGAGAIILHKDAVHGLTTAASVWLVAGIGLACGCGLYTLAIVTTGLALGTLRGLKLFERRFLSVDKRPAQQPLLIEALLSYQAEQPLAIQECLRRSGADVLRLQVASDLQRQETTLTLHVRTSTHQYAPRTAPDSRRTPHAGRSQNPVVPHRTGTGA